MFLVAFTAYAVTCIRWSYNCFYGFSRFFMYLNAVITFTCNNYPFELNKCKKTLLYINCSFFLFYIPMPHLVSYNKSKLSAQYFFQAKKETCFNYSTHRPQQLKHINGYNQLFIFSCRTNISIQLNGWVGCLFLLSLLKTTFGVQFLTLITYLVFLMLEDKTMSKFMSIFSLKQQCAKDSLRNDSYHHKNVKTKKKLGGWGFSYH